MAIASNTGPSLPPEIERQVFELSALADSRTIPRLLPVARRVNIWIEPLLYRIVSVVDLSPEHRNKHQIPEHVFHKMLESKPLPLWLDQTRQLSVAIRGGDHMEQVLSMCRNTSNLALILHPHDLFGGYKLAKSLALVAKMPLVRLSAHIGSLFHPDAADFSHPVFARLTHLTLLDTFADHMMWATDLGKLPYLTHVSLNFPSSCYPTAPHDKFVREVFRSCVLMEVFIFCCDGNEALHGNIPYYPYLADDPRSLLLAMGNFLEDWGIGAEGGADYWVRAERFIKQRQSGEISPSDYAMFCEDE
ncbi:hypothetical protein DFH06DRAFT_1199987 [Mycena polygramma]|nr:hypothetical protein DFH06DRAFT_1199987 [Mycena polygramma]